VRVVSLVPSATETLLALGVPPVACTRFCEQPGIATVGGTKDPDVPAVLALHPDLVVVNDEENRIVDADALRTAGIALHNCSPRSVADVGPAVAALAAAVGVPVPAAVQPPAWNRWLADVGASRPTRAAVTFVWRRPWMTLGPDTYGASVLDCLGLASVTTGRSGSRYPTVELEAVRAARPALVLLPSEPYPFRDRHRDQLAGELPGVDVRLLDGRDLFWWGSRTPDALARLRDTLS
jgi:ABC-type Fe3+-hydroxamate transport system substrate-binding protein